MQNTDFEIRYEFTCKTKNLLYVISCSKCGKQYIGETGTELRLRMNVHRQQIRDPNLRHLKVSKHIHDCAQGEFTVSPFYKLHTDNQTIREYKEAYFIRKLHPELNSA